MEPIRLNPTEFESFKKELHRIDKEKGNTYAFGMIRGAIYFNKLTTQQQIDLVNMVWYT